MKAAVQSIAVAIGVFVLAFIVVIALSTFFTVQGTAHDAAGFPIPQTADQVSATAANLGLGVMVSIVLGLIAGAMHYWRPSRKA